MAVLCSPVHRAKDERVDWMYSGPGMVNREEYLLGKRIDKLVDPTLAEVEREEEVMWMSQFFPVVVVSSSTTGSCEWARSLVHQC